MKLDDCRAAVPYGCGACRWPAPNGSILAALLPLRMLRPVGLADYARDESGRFLNLSSLFFGVPMK
jgi:hypothetical protein